MVPDPRLDKSFHDAADQVLNTLLDFNPIEWGLPPFENSESWTQVSISMVQFITDRKLHIQN